MTLFLCKFIGGISSENSCTNIIMAKYERNPMEMFWCNLKFLPVIEIIFLPFCWLRSHTDCMFSCPCTSFCCSLFLLSHLHFYPPPLPPRRQAFSVAPVRPSVIPHGIRVLWTIFFYYLKTFKTDSVAFIPLTDFLNL